MGWAPAGLELNPDSRGYGVNSSVLAVTLTLGLT
jgi:hypothetical protein